MIDEKEQKEVQNEEKQEISEKEKRIRDITTLYYSRKDIQDAIFKFSENREIIPRYFENFGKRPDSLQYPSDILNFINKGATSFHCSQELWKDPLLIEAGMSQEQLNELRLGWDLILDIDSKYFDYSKIMAKLIVEALEFHGVKNIGVKFSGSKGMHIIIPSKAFPEKVNEQKTSDMFPEWPRIISLYLSEIVKKELINKISQLYSKQKYIKDFEAPKEVMPDLVLVSPRHLFRMPYSVDYHEPICIKRDNKIEIIKIGKFVDSFFKNKEDLQIANTSDLGYETVSLSLTNNKTKFNKIKDVIRHKINEDLLRIKLESGREVKVTVGHSVFILKKGKICVIKGNEIKKGDYVIGLRKLNLKNKFMRNLNLLDELAKELDSQKKRNIFLYDFDNSIFKEVYKILSKDEKKERKAYNWKVYNILPLDIYELLVQKDNFFRDSFRDSKIKFCKHGGGAIGLQNKITLNKSFMRLLGYYTSEGHCDSRGRVILSFGAHEKELIEDSIEILRDLGLNPRIEKPHKTATQIVTQSTILKLIFESLFKCGKNAKEKRVPSVIWNVNDELKIGFLNSYIKGDGHLEKRWSKIVISTVSKKLKEDLCFLLTSLGLGYSISKRKVTKYSKGKNPSYVIIIQGKEDVASLGFESFSKIKKNSLINRFPIKELKLEQFISNSRWRNQYNQNKIIRRSYDFIKNLNPNKSILKLIEGDCTFLKVLEIKKINPRHKYVYDISVKGDENFVGGNCILLHNSLHEKTALASVIIDKNKINSFNLKDADPLKIKPISFLLEARKNEAKELLVSALDWFKEKEKDKDKIKKTAGKEYREIIFKEINENMFPPCVKNILNGLSDGKKRALFILINFYRSLNLSIEDIEKKVYEWNKKNKPPLKEGYIKSQLSWTARQKKMLPPNCDKDYYTGIGVCMPDDICGSENKTIKNPINYVARKVRRGSR